MLGSLAPRPEPLHVVVMALALAAAAFLGAVSGLVWQSTGLGQPDDSGGDKVQVESDEADGG